MKINFKVIIVLILLLSKSFSGFAQRTCATMEHLEEEILQNPDRLQYLNDLELKIIEWNSASTLAERTGTLTIPVVVHVVYNTAAQNISNEQILSQIDILNEDFRRLNPDADNNWSQASDCMIEFCLASSDINGHATTGITRTQTSITAFSDNDAVKSSIDGGIDPWSPQNYLNIWVCPLGGNLLGYAQFPGGNADTDGVVINFTAFGNLGTAAAPFDLGRTTTHEIGHYLNLRHIWGGGCNEDDNVSDTPDSDEANFGCSIGHSSCGSIDMVQNYMDYSNDVCMNLFTTGQKNRMRPILYNERTSLLNSIGCNLPISCDKVSNVVTTNISDTNVNLIWDNVVGAQTYTFRYKPMGTSDWMSGYSGINSTSASLENLMPNTIYQFEIHPDCNSNYTAIEFQTTCASSLACDYCFTGTDISINSSQILNESQISGNIIVKNGATLTINSDVQFSESSSIYIEGGSILIIDGAILSKCPTALSWQGIKVAGHLTFGFGTPNPGQVIMKNGATVSNATIGIDMRNEYTYSTFYPIEYGGGILTMDGNSKISDCETGIHFAPYGWGSVIGAGSQPEQSIINNSSIENCRIGIYSERNIGLQVLNSSFVGNNTDIESFMTSFELNNNTFTAEVDMNAEYPNFQGATIVDNDFVDAPLSILSQGNAVPFIFDRNSVFGSGFEIWGDLDFQALNNDFYDANIGFTAWSSGDDQFNMVMDNAFYGNEFGSSVYGINDVEYLTNCFENTDNYDIELNNGAAIHENQGDQDLLLSAGNCFDGGSRIGTGSGTSQFNYWTKDGTLPHSCKRPGYGNFIVEEAETELTVENCGTGINYTGILPSRYRDCQCDNNGQDCKENINALKSEIIRIENDNSINPWVKKWLIAKYKRCLDKLNKMYVKGLLENGDMSVALEHLSTQSSFRLRIMAYGIMMNNGDIIQARTYLDSIDISSSGEQGFVTAQNIYIDYLENRNLFTLSENDSISLLTIGLAENPYSGYARSIFYKLTGEEIDIELTHIERIPLMPRQGEKDLIDGVSFYPNPLVDHLFNMSISNYVSDAEYDFIVYAMDGRLIKKGKVVSALSKIHLEEGKGVYMINVYKDGQWMLSKKLVKL